MKELDSLLSQAFDLALSEVERIARKIMKQNPRCKSFIMGMGSASFYDIKGDPVGDWGSLPYPKYLEELDDFLSKYNHLNITGFPVKIVGHNGETITNW